MKLSKPQLDLLTSAVACGRVSCADSYPPAKALVRLGLATEYDGKMGGHWLEPTEAGRAHPQLKD